jgi:hypothetical protein
MRLRACERPASSHRSLVPQPGHRIGERVYCGAPIRGTGARCRDLALAEHVPDQFRKPGWSDDHCLDVQFHQRPPSPCGYSVRSVHRCEVPARGRPGQSASGEDVGANPRSTTHRGTHTGCGAHVRPDAAFRSALASVPARVSLVKNEYPPPTADHDRSGLLLQRPERVPGLHRAPFPSRATARSPTPPVPPRSRPCLTRSGPGSMYSSQMTSVLARTSSSVVEPARDPVHGFT